MSATPSTKGSRQPAVTRELLLATAERLFLEKGFRATSLQEIADEAGRTTGSIYSAFSGKDDLFLEVFRRQLRRQEALWQEALGRVSRLSSAPEAIGAGLAMAMPKPEWMAVHFEFVSFASRDERLARELAQIYRDAEVVLEKVLAGVLQESPLPAPRVAAILAALSRGFSQTWFADPGSADPTLFADAAGLILGIQTGAPAGADKA